MATRTLEVVISAKDLYSKVMTKAQIKARGLSSTLSKMNGILKRAGAVGRSFAIALGVMIAPLAIAFKALIDFNKELANVATLIPGNIGRVRELGVAVQAMSIETGKATKDLTKGLFQVISAFGDTADSVERLNIVAKASVAGLSTTTEALELLSAVTKGYGDTSTEALQKASDLAFMTNKLGQTTFPELASSMGKVIPVAVKMKVSQEELFAGFATLTGVTGGAAEVSTQMTGILNAMIKPTEGMSDAIEGLGFSGSEAMVAQLGLVGSLKALIGTTDGSTESVGELFGRAEALTAVFALTGSQASVFEGKLNAMATATGATNDAFKEQTEGVNKLGFMWEQFKRKITFITQFLGERFEPVFIAVVSTMNKSFGIVLEAMRAVHNGWLGIKLVATVAIFAIVDAIRLVINGLKAFLIPFEKAFAGLKKLGVIDVNPLEGITDSVKDFGLITTDVTKSVLDDIFETNLAYDKAKQTVEGIVKAQGQIKVKSNEIAQQGGIVPQQSKTGVPTASQEAAAKALEALEKKSPFGVEPTAEGMTELEKLQFDQQAKLELMRTFAGEKLTLLQETNASEAEVERQGAELKRGFEQQLQDDKMEMREAATASLIGSGLSLLAESGKQSKKMFKISKAAAIAQAIVDSKAAIVGAYKTGVSIGGPPLGAAFAAIAAVQTAKQIKGIAATKFGGGGGAGGGGGGGGAPAPERRPELPIGRPEKPERGAQMIDVKIINPMVDANWEAVGEQIVGSINKAGDRNIKVNVNAVEGAAALL